MLPSLLVLLGAASVALAELVPGAFIVEVDTESLRLQKRANGLLTDSPIRIALGNLAGGGVKYEVRQQFTDQPDLFHGFSINVDSGMLASDLLKIHGVKAVWPVRRRTIPTGPTSGSGAPITASALGGSSDNSTGLYPSELSRRSNLVKMPAPSAYLNDTFAPHRQAGVDKTHAAGQLGKGVLVCIIDTGVDYKNPILGGCFGPGCHVSTGYDLVGDHYNGHNKPHPGPDPYSACNSHGTHVTGIIGALANKYDFSGVAPEASLGMFRVFGCNGSTSDDVELQAYLMAMKQNCDVINLSLGGPTGYESAGPVGRLIQRAVSKGIFTAVSAGNDGSEGMFYASDPASNRGGVSVAAINSLELPALTANVFGYPSFPTFPYLGVIRFNTTKAPHRVYFTSLDPDTVDDACSPLPASTPDLKGYVVVVQRGTCAFTTKYKNVYDAGGRLLLVYNNAAATGQVYVGFTLGNPGLDAVTSLRREDGLALLKTYVAASKHLIISFPEAKVAPRVLDTLTGGLISDFSSWGTTLDMYGVNLGAPGGNILSTFPLKDGGIAVDSGTSMSSPFVAGAVAVIMAARKRDGLSVPQIRNLLSTTATPIRSALSNSSEFESSARQGSGMIQVDLACGARTFTEPDMIFLNDSRHFKSVQTIRITNKNPSPMIYNFKNVPAQARALYNTSGDILPSIEPRIVDAHAGVTFKPSSLTIAPGATHSIQATFTLPRISALEASLYPTYSGWVQVAGSSPRTTETLHLPYFGLSGVLLNVPVLDTTDIANGPGNAYPLLSSNQSTYKFPKGPTLYARLAMGTPSLTVDLVLAGVTFKGTIPTNHNDAKPKPKPATPPTPPSENHPAKEPEKPHPAGPRGLYSDTKILGNVFNATSLPRDAFVTGGKEMPFTETDVPFRGKYFSDGATITSDKGVKYRLLLRALKITGDAKYEDQWESWLSPSFSFRD